MNQDTWTAVDQYIVDKLIPKDPILEEALRASKAANLPPYNVSPAQGKMLYLLAKIHGARTILEVGTLGGYSTIWLARALPAGGRLITLEADPKHAEVTRMNIEHAGLSDRVELRIGKALDTLPELAKEHRGPFDFIFIDADKPNNPGYLEWSLKLSRTGTLIVGDNVVRDGKIIDPKYPDPKVQGTQQFFDLLAKEQRVTATAIQTVGSKGYDGFALALVLDLTANEGKNVHTGRT